MCGITFVPGRHAPVPRGAAAAADTAAFSSDFDTVESPADVTFELDSLTAETPHPLSLQLPDDTAAVQGEYSFDLDQGESTPPPPEIPPAGDDLNWFAAEGFEPFYAGFWRRFFAVIIDGILLSLVAGFAFSAVMGDTIIKLQQMGSKGVKPDPQAMQLLVMALIPKIMLLTLLFMVIDWLYNSILISSSRQATLGKMLMGIVVTDMNGERISFLRATARYLVRAFISGFLLIGYLIQLFTARRQALHDLIAGTLVVRR
jgi:uncharacterized RDD family membrane protein YckC